MNLYKSCNYKNVSEEDLLEYKRIKESECIFPGDKGIRGRLRKNNFHEYPKSVRHYNSLFPNNYLDILESSRIKLLHYDNLIDFEEELIDKSIY